MRKLLETVYAKKFQAEQSLAQLNSEKNAPWQTCKECGTSYGELVMKAKIAGLEAHLNQLQDLINQYWHEAD